MTTEFKEDEVTNLVAGDTWGLCTTEAFGMVRHTSPNNDVREVLINVQGMDIPDVTLVIQWRASCKLSALWQRFGHAARDRAVEGTALLFAEKEYFDDVREDKRKKKATDAPEDQLDAKHRIINSSTAIGIAHPEGDNSAQATSSGSAANIPMVIVTDMQLKELMRPPAGTLERVSRQRRENELDRAMDLLINANYRGVGCRRKIFNIQFDNGSAGATFLYYINNCNNIL